MAKEAFPIDDPEDEVPPANPARLRASTLTGCLFILVVLGFIVWFAIQYHAPADAPGGLFGSLTPSRLPTTA